MPSTVLYSPLPTLGHDRLKPYCVVMLLLSASTLRRCVSAAEGVLPTGGGDHQSEGAARPPRQADTTAREGTA